MHRLVALVLAIPLGMLGVHNFYLGNWTYGALQLALTVVALLGWPWLALFVAAWVVVEIVLIILGTGDYATRKSWNRGAEG